MRNCCTGEIETKFRCNLSFVTYEKSLFVNNVSAHRVFLCRYKLAELNEAICKKLIGNLTIHSMTKNPCHVNMMQMNDDYF